MLNSKRIIEPATKKLINKTQLSPKIITTSSCRFDDSNKRISLHVIYYCPSTPTNKGSRSSQVPTTRYKNFTGEFITKEINNYQITKISKIKNNKYHAHKQLSINTTYT